ncbi:hypothetical protein [Actinosynnema sp. NPDC023587]|uniref:hypothetical protein n=1 Tax=Actinosynnema sp. NPDC023587 TaxID=3154695 RepID=UPI0033FF0F54
MTALVPLTEAEILARYPGLEGLVLLRCAGWKFLPVEEEREQLDAARVWPHGWRDALRIRSETDALGLRMRVETREIVWDYAGTLRDVVSELLVLPVPGARRAPMLAIGTAPVAEAGLGPRWRL